MDPFVGLNRMAPDWNPNGDLEILPSPDDSISSISWHPTDNYIAAGSWDKQVRLWQIHGGVAQPKAAIAHEAPVLNVSFLSDGSKIFSAGCDCQVLCWDLASNKTMQVAKHDNTINYARWLADKNCLITGSWDATLKYWDPRQGITPVGVVNTQKKVYAVDVTERTNLVVVACADRVIHVIDLNAPTTPYTSLYSPLKFQSKCVANFADGTGFALGSIEGRIAIHNLHPNMTKDNFTFKCHRIDKEVLPVNAMDFHPIFGTFVSCGGDGGLAFWDKNNRSSLKKLPLSSLPISTCKLNPKATALAYSASYDWSRGIEGYEKLHSKGQHLLLRQVQDDEFKPK